MVGQFIPSSGTKSFMLSWGIRESREISLQKGYINIQKIADNLHLSTQHIEAAQRIYLMALQRNFTMGRNNSYVAASCLYTICRREKSPIMLIDFSDILQTPVKPLGKTFLKLLRLLHISVPNIDPSLFLERFAYKLNLKNDIYKVTYTGIKLIQAMTRDWISTGRRPTGLCGASLLIATRIHGININSNTIAEVVRISNPTIIKRLYEFKNTNIAKIKASEFDKISIDDIPSSSIPPCVISDNKKKIKYNLLQKSKTLSLCGSEEQYALCSNSTCSVENYEKNTDLQNGNICSYSDNNSTKCIRDQELDQSKFFNSTQNSIINSSNEVEYCNSTITASSSIFDDKEQYRDDNINKNNQIKEYIQASSNEINLDEICNDNPEGNDIDNLAFKIINTINIEKNSEFLKISDSPLLNELGSTKNNHTKYNASNKENYNLNLQNQDIQNNPRNLSPILAQNIMIGSSKLQSSNLINHETSISTITDNNGDDEYNEIKESNEEKYKNSNNFDMINDNNLKQNNKLLDNSAYCTTLKQTVNSELSNVINDINEEFDLFDNCNNNALSKNSSNSTSSLNKINDVNNILTDFNYFFENNSNTINDQTANFDVNSDDSEQLNDETISDSYDSEIENIILSEKERKIKMLIWDDVMKGCMPNLSKNIKRPKKRQNTDINNSKNKIPNNKNNDDDPQDQLSTGDSVIKALEKSNKLLPKKINYDVLKSLFSS
ncbi:transcription factor IIIb subunit, putative [Plasmodium berghei]|uniref:B-related factor 1 n=3 Tax=Plasmodium berghei TaxID=5821 RepID=A0A509APD2_PLABA|nr:transcription factor IIIb subunit, putative [Plasmodium berghei ANKA]CXI90868.1 transcription factor IIIb subunit, putative [Plasmodium berghei]SCL96328.1 transcription factor IIIb subunit, putative [Plasmodium berghei]SCM18199.1 transcription factor IIIb subunit, putative [Plasmodium berghei]SCN27627.1 transcription factor IIIb subunit, putative [Plasmodium berghei]VUC57511.1 transcription factor IIIb subunit, putative [Plasmodium berghei ANKA]|eukprot:XP_034423282.1 transcription factor IIIb subunit, putative [Plasmodium berghei ANKA]